MTAPRFDVEAWAIARFGILNMDGGGGHELGVRKFDCPFCGDAGGHGWVNVNTGWLRCWHPGCGAHGGMNAVEAVRRLEGFRTWTEALVWARREYPTVGPPLPLLPAPPVYNDWCALSREAVPLARCDPRGSGRYLTPVSAEAMAFVRRQWGLGLKDALRWGLQVCLRGRLAYRVVIPVVMGGRLVAFQARTFRRGDPKYLTSQHGRQGKRWAECGRPAEAILYNSDAIQEGRDVVVVEGAGDVMRWARNAAEAGDRPWWYGGEVGGGVREPIGAAGRPVAPFCAVALLGTALTEEKAALLAAKRPGRVIVALDTGAERESQRVAEALAAWGLNTGVGRWVGGKDAGAGARLVVAARAGGGLTGAVRGRLGR